MTPMTPDRLKEVEARAKKRLGLDKSPVPVPLPTLTCRRCGKPFEVPEAMTAFFARYNFTTEKRWPCPPCQAIEQEERRRHEDQERRRAIELERQRHQGALEAIRSDLPGALARVGVWVHWQNANLNDCPDLPAELVAEARRWAAAPMGIVYLSGPSGSGKTYLAAAILAEVLAAGLYPPQAVRFIGERTYLDDLKASFNQGDPELRPRLLPPNHIQRLPLLFFDDLATSRLTDWAKGEIAGLIEGRHAEDLATVITSNLSLDELARQVDSRLASRIGENGAVLQFPARDLRICGRLKAPRWTPTGRGGPGRRAPVDDAAAPLADPPARGPLSAVAPGEAEPGNAADLAGGQSFGPSASRPRAGAKKNLGKILTNRQPVE